MLSVGLALSLGLAWQAVSPEVVRHAQAGIDAQNQGRITDAIVEFKKVTELAPELAPAFVNLASAYMKNNDFGSAIPPLKRALSLDPKLQGAEQMLGIALLAQGYAAEALPYLERTQTLAAVGIAKLQTGRLPEAIASLQAELAQNPNNPDLLYYLGKASGLLSKQSFDTLLAAHPESARAHFALGENYAGMRRTADAEREFNEALRLKPGTPGFHLALGQLYVRTTQWPQAENEFRTETKIQPGSAEAAYELGNALLQQGKAQAASVELAKADVLQAEMPETLYALGKARSMTGDAIGAEKAWSQLIKIEDSSSLASQAHFGLAALYRKQGKSAEADREMQAFRRIQAAGKRSTKLEQQP
jgi:tetratricopeptide (TPR) repeat protein